MIEWPRRAGEFAIGRQGRWEVARRRVSEPESLHSAPRAPAGPKTSETTIKVQQSTFKYGCDFASQGLPAIDWRAEVDGAYAIA